MDVKRYKAGTLKGQLTTAEIRKLIRAHNKASSIKIPPTSTREDIVGILQKAGYVVNHEKAELRPVSKGKVQKLKVISQKTIAEELPKPKTKEEKETARKLNLKKKQDKEAELIKKGATLQRLISKKTKPQDQSPKPKTSTISTQTEEPKKKRKMQVGIRFKSTDEVEIVEPNDTAIQNALKQRYEGFSGIERVKLTATQIKEMNDNEKRPIFDVSTPKKANIVIVEAKVEGATNKTLSKVTLNKKAEPKKEAPLNKKGEPYIISKIKDSNAKLYDYNFTKEKDIVKWFNGWKRDRRTLIRDLKEALSKGQVTKEDLKPIEPINIQRTKQYKIREGQIFRAIKEQEK
jgi:hypothetical protein